MGWACGIKRGSGMGSALCHMLDQGVKTALVLWNCSLKMLAKSFQPTRLETRTKESNMYASWWVENP